MSRAFEVCEAEVERDLVTCVQSHKSGNMTHPSGEHLEDLLDGEAVVPLGSIFLLLPNVCLVHGCSQVSKTPIFAEALEDFQDNAAVLAASPPR